jgi:hypothetical protein
VVTIRLPFKVGDRLLPVLDRVGPPPVPLLAHGRLDDLADGLDAQIVGDGDPFADP